MTETPEVIEAHWPIWIGSPDGDGFSMRELVPGSDEYAAAAKRLPRAVARAIRNAFREADE